MLQLGSIFFAVGISASFGAATAPPVTRTHVEHRAVFDLVAHETDLRAVCAGREPLAVEFKRTAADVAAAIFSGAWYTPVHVRVTCAGR